MYYGNPSAPGQEQPGKVWDNNNSSVWHLEEDGTSSEYKDSSGNGNVGIGGAITANDAPTRVDALTGYGQNFPNADDRIQVGNWDISGTALTLSGWFYHLTNTADDRIITKTTGTNVQNHAFLLGINNGTQLRMRLKTGVDPATGTTDFNVGTITDDTWIYATAKYDGSNMYVYKDGDLIGTTPKTGNIYVDNTFGVAIGNNPTGARSFNGQLDEVRASNVSRSDTWIKTQYNMQKASSQGAPSDPDTVDDTKFIKQKGRPQEYYKYRRLITINKNKVVGTHTDFPVLINITLNPAKVEHTN